MGISYHKYFYRALQIYFRDYLDKLTILNEVSLAREPIRIDYLIIINNSQTVIDLDIANIFRKYNIIEFKAPDDYISIDDYYRALSYVYYYKSTELVTGNKKKQVNDIKIDELTLTLFANHYPHKLVKHLTVRDRYIKEKEAGIYLIKGEVLPIQLINTSIIKNVKQNFSLIPFADNKLIDRAVITILNEYKNNNTRSHRQKYFFKQTRTYVP